jgi:hypothetical protein
MLLPSYKWLSMLETTPPSVTEIRNRMKEIRTAISHCKNRQQTTTPIWEIKLLKKELRK